jgi:hypothetical protein
MFTLQNGGIGAFGSLENSVSTDVKAVSPLRSATAVQIRLKPFHASVPSA